MTDGMKIQEFTENILDWITTNNHTTIENILDNHKEEIVSYFQEDIDYLVDQQLENYCECCEVVSERAELEEEVEELESTIKTLTDTIANLKDVVNSGVRPGYDAIADIVNDYKVENLIRSRNVNITNPR